MSGRQVIYLGAREDGVHKLGLKPGAFTQETIYAVREAMGGAIPNWIQRSTGLVTEVGVPFGDGPESLTRIEAFASHMGGQVVGEAYAQYVDAVRQQGQAVLEFVGSYFGANQPQ